MKRNSHFITLLFICFCCTPFSYAQFGGLTKKILDGGTDMATEGGLKKILKQPQAITTSFKDVNKTGFKPPSFMEGEQPQPLYLLPKAPTGGYILCAGFYEMTNKSYCLHAGTRGPSTGDGYMLAPVLGPKQDIVVLILKNAEKHPDVKQHSIQILLWAIIARTRFADFNAEIKLTATTLLSANDLLKLEGGALGVLPASMMDRAKDKLPAAAQTVFEAENNIRRLAASGNASYEEMEKYAVLAGISSQPDSEVPSGTWSLHPDGYYIRFFPKGYSITRVQLFIPEELIATKKGWFTMRPMALPAPQMLERNALPKQTNHSMRIILKN